MESLSSNQFDIFALYRQFCDIKSGVHLQIDKSEKAKILRDGMAQLSKMVDLTMNIRVSIFDELRKLMSHLNLAGDFSEFSQFYDFIFLVCRENGQKNITVSRAIAAWELVLAGRFRLLNQWCDFVEKNQRYNISEDTWCQVLAFSRCVHEDLEGYDAEGAWPTLIDDFVEHMYRITGANDSSSNVACNCVDSEGPFTSEDLLPGLKNLPGFKRKHCVDSRGNGLKHSCISPDVLDCMNSFKRRKQEQQQQQQHSKHGPENVSGKGSPTFKVNSPSNSPPCAVEGFLSKGFSRLLSSPPCMQKQEQTVFYTLRMM